MKKITYILATTLIIAFISSCKTPKDILVPGDTHAVLMRVETETITQANTDQTCNFGQKEGESNEDYTIKVNVGDYVVWSGIDSGIVGNGQVLIDSIKYVSGTNFFGTNTITSNGQGRVIGVIASGSEEQESKYSIYFRVFNNGIERNGTFIIDPKIRIKRR